MIYTAFYTKDTPYEEVMNTHLLPSLKKFNLKYEIFGIFNTGNWQKNMIGKITSILQTLEKYREDVIYIDCDATIEQYPKLFEEIPPEFDIACHYLDWYLNWKGIIGENKRELLGGTLMFRYNEKVIKFVKEWLKELKHSWTQTTDQRLLQKMLTNHLEIKVYNLPPEYCVIVDHKYKIPKHIKDPVIIHHQISRTFKSKL